MTMIIKYAIILRIIGILQEMFLKKKFIAHILIFSSLLFPAALISCKNTSETKLAYTENNTIKNSIKEKEQNITWTQELEEERLTERITRSSMTLGPDVPYSKELFKINRKNQNAVYPELADFGSLDTRNIKKSVKEKINAFCTSLANPEHSGADSYFSRKYLFNYVFFIKDLEEGWKTRLGKEYPRENVSEGKTDDKEKEAEAIFSKWTFGQAFVGAEIMQIPVRFYASCGIIDVTIFLNSSGNNEIYQISIDRWKKI